MFEVKAPCNRPMFHSWREGGQVSTREIRDHWCHFDRYSKICIRRTEGNGIVRFSKTTTTARVEILMDFSIEQRAVSAILSTL